MFVSNYGFNFQMNLSDKIFTRPGQDLENMLKHPMIESLYSNPGPNCVKLYSYYLFSCLTFLVLMKKK